MKRKLLSIALALCMVLGMMPTALAGDEALSGLSSYTLYNGSNYWINGDETGSITMNAGATATFDLKGHTLSGAITVASGTTLTIKDSSENKTGKVTGTVTNNGTLKIEGGDL